MKLQVIKGYKDPEDNYLEIVERKGIGHPDTIADKLAQECSRVYAKYCMENFGVILHHNIDKFYIGGGLFLYEDGKIIRKHPIRVEMNGRVSSEYAGNKIDLESLFTAVIKKYLSTIMPRINPEEDLDIIINPTQYSKQENWYKPQSIDDLPDAKTLYAADTSLCVNHSSKTFCEEATLKVESFFWEFNDDGYACPKYDEVGQDIKVMVTRKDKDVDIYVSLPIFKDKFKDKEEYDKIIDKYTDLLYKEVAKIPNPKGYIYKIDINKNLDGSYHIYGLVKGSCIECGEEGVVGRGNNAQGLIPSFREHTMEAPCGKNERYHTGCVINFMANKAVKRINDELGIKCTLYSLTRNKGSILEPYFFYLMVNDLSKKQECEKIIEEEFTEDFMHEIIKPINLF